MTYMYLFYKQSKKETKKKTGEAHFDNGDESIISYLIVAACQTDLGSKRNSNSKKILFHRHAHI